MPFVEYPPTAGGVLLELMRAKLELPGRAAATTRIMLCPSESLDKHRST
jgi:hypothetical protein